MVVRTFLNAEQAMNWRGFYFWILRPLLCGSHTHIMSQKFRQERENSNRMWLFDSSLIQVGKWNFGLSPVIDRLCLNHNARYGGCSCARRMHSVWARSDFVFLVNWKTMWCAILNPPPFLHIFLNLSLSTDKQEELFWLSFYFEHLLNIMASALFHHMSFQNHYHRNLFFFRGNVWESAP